MASVKEKKRLLHYILATEVFARKEIGWILDYVKNHTAIMENLHIVESVGSCPRGIRFSSIAFNQTAPITMFLEGKKTFDCDQIFHEMRLHWQKPLYIELVFHDRWKQALYLKALEDNPFASWNETLDEELERKVSRYLSAYHEEQSQTQILTAINQALDEKDEQRFKELTEKYRQQKSILR